MEPRPRIRTEMPPLGSRMTCTPALRPSSSSSTCAAGMPCRSAARTVETALAVISSEGAPAGGADAGGWAHPHHASGVATSATRAALPGVPRITAQVPGVLLQACDSRFTGWDRVQRVPRREGRTHEQRGQARYHAVLTDHVVPEQLHNTWLYSAIMT